MRKNHLENIEILPPEILVPLNMITVTLYPNSRYTYKDRKLWGWRVELRA